MANHESAVKRNRQAQARRLRNKMDRKRMKTSIRKLDEAIATGSEEAAKEALKQATVIIAKTAGKGTIHKKTGSRKVSRLTKRVNAMGSEA